MFLIQLISPILILIAVVMFIINDKKQKEHLAILSKQKLTVVLENESLRKQIEKLTKELTKSESKKILKSSKADKAMRTCPECGGKGINIGDLVYYEESMQGGFECRCGCLWECNSKDF